MSTSLILLFLIKHFICDFPLQAFPYMYKNKGTYGHPGGMLHSSIHQIGTFLIIVTFFSGRDAFWLSAIDYFFHYHIDWAKMNINRIYDLRPDNSEWFWILLGFDQLLHYLTYVFLIYLVN